MTGTEKMGYRKNKYIKSLLVLIYAFLGIVLSSAYAITFDDMLAHKATTDMPFWGDYYKNIKWISHAPDPNVKAVDGEADYRGQIDIGLMGLYGDRNQETIKVIWGQGVSDHSLRLELYKDAEMKTHIATLEPAGIQPNFKIEDMDGDGKLEIVLWGAVSDPSMSQDVGDASKLFEGHSSLHLFTVSTYKLTDAGYKLSREYTTKEKYEPFCEEQPKE